jgi:glycosyltransferase involved in cell wall biosynthesis
MDIQKVSDHPRVSVITAFLNGERFFSEAIESVITQTFGNWEMLLVDDGSGPAATAIARSYAAKYPDKIFYLEHAGHVNHGVTVSRNLGIRKARGEFIAILDADDVWLPTKLDEHLAVLDKHPEVGLVSGTAIYWNSWRVGSDRHVRSGPRQNTVISPPEAMLASYPLGTAPTPCPSDFVLRADVARRIRGFEEQFVGDKMVFEDQAFLSKLYLASSVYFCSAPLIKYRFHLGSVSSRFHAAGKGLKREVELYFLEWFEQYLRENRYPDPRVQSSLRRAFRRYHSPRVHSLLSLPKKMANRVRRAIVS